MTMPSEPDRVLPRGWWQAFMWYCSALLMVLAHRGVNGGRAPTFVAVVFAGVAWLWAIQMTIEGLVMMRERGDLYQVTL